MPKGIDPKAYAARVTKAKKVIAAMDPAMKAKIKDMYPKISKEQVARQAMGGKDISSMEKRMKSVADRKKKMTAEMNAFGKTRTPSKAVKTPMPKTATKAPAKPTTKAKTLTGPAAVRELQRQVSPAGVKKAEMDAKKAIAKKYPGLTKKSK
jgi:hypothetical protein